MKKSLLALLFLACSAASLARDTLTVMHYNLLYYGITTSFCNNQNNNVDLKDQYLSNIIDFVRPDIFTVNELGRGQDNANRILDNVMNVVGNNRYSAASYTNTTNSTIVNMLYYDHNKFSLYFEAVVANLMRDINLYTLYYNDQEMLAAGDTIFLTAIVAHLKAGGAAEDQQTRTAEAQAVMDYINANNMKGNLLFLGDFNMGSSFEQAFQHITYHPNEAIRFYDPINQPGQWYNNPNFAPYHTQSTRSGSHDCFVSGGLDDRYDLILASRAVMQGYYGLQYIDGSYKALGQDGNRFHQSVIYRANNSAPQVIIESLYWMSDHLPVVMKMRTDQITAGQQPLLASIPSIRFNNPAREHLNLQARQSATGLDIAIFSLTGEKVRAWTGLDLMAGEGQSFELSGLQPGVYLIRALGKDILPFSAKLIKQ